MLQVLQAVFPSATMHPRTVLQVSWRRVPYLQRHKLSTGVELKSEELHARQPLDPSAYFTGSVHPAIVVHWLPASQPTMQTHSWFLS